MKSKSLSALCTLALLASCSYNIMDKRDSAYQNNKSEHKKEAPSGEIKIIKSCSYAPLWLAPMNKHYADLPKLMEKHGISYDQVVSSKHVVYPYVLFTRSCMALEIVDSEVESE